MVRCCARDRQTLQQCTRQALGRFKHCAFHKAIYEAPGGPHAYYKKVCDMDERAKKLFDRRRKTMTYTQILNLLRCFEARKENDYWWYVDECSNSGHAHYESLLKRSVRDNILAKKFVRTSVQDKLILAGLEVLLKYSGVHSNPTWTGKWDTWRYIANELETLINTDYENLSPEAIKMYKIKTGILNK